jgi:hypothetical protein
MCGKPHPGTPTRRNPSDIPPPDSGPKPTDPVGLDEQGREQFLVYTPVGERPVGLGCREREAAHVARTQVMSDPVVVPIAHMISFLRAHGTAQHSTAQHSTFRSMSTVPPRAL